MSEKVNFAQALRDAYAKLGGTESVSGPSIYDELEKNGTLKAAFGAKWDVPKIKQRVSTGRSQLVNPPEKKGTKKKDVFDRQIEKNGRAASSSNGSLPKDQVLALKELVTNLGAAKVKEMADLIEILK